MKTNLKPDIFILKNVKKICSTMKISLFLILFSAISLNSGTVFSQDKRMTVNMENLTVREVIDDILYSKLDQAYMMCEEVGENSFVLKSQHEYTNQQRITITGRVTDNNTGEPLPGVSILIQGTTTGTVTNYDGNYSIEVPGPEAILQFSYIGYMQISREVGDQRVINVSLETELTALDEIVVVGYGTQRKENLTGSVSQIGSEQIDMRVTNSATASLSGLSPNLNIDVSFMGGEADATMDMNVRGIGSLSSSNPYILIDGTRATQTELAALNARDIETISVLKDAAASAIYGAQAAYGVILIQTKRGERGREFEFNYKNNIMFRNRIYVPSSVDALTWAKVFNDATMTQAGQIAIGEEQMEKIRAYMNGEIEYQTEPHPNNPNYWLGIESGASGGWFSGYANNDWMDIMYKDIEFAQKHDISARGGSENITYYISGGYFHDPGSLNFAGDNENHERYNFTSNVSADLTNWFEISNNTRFSQVSNVFPATLDSDNRGRIYHDIRRFVPIAPYKTPEIRDEEGNVIVPEQLAIMPGWTKNNGYTAYDDRIFVTTFRGRIQLIPNELILRGDFTYRLGNYDETFNYKKWTLLGPDGNPNIVNQASNNQIRKTQRTTNYTSFNVMLDYTKSFAGIHNLSLLAGVQQEEHNFSSLQVARLNVLAPDLNSQNVAVGDVLGPYNPMSTWGTLGIFGRITYNYQEKYLFESNLRYDGTSRFPEDARWGFFPSASIGWNIHREDFWMPVSDVFGIFRLRVSYGKLGNQEVASYLHLPGIPMFRRLNWIIDGERPDYAGMPNIVSPDITWENSFTRNLGVDLGFLENRLLTTFDIYERKTENMFGPSAALPAVLGTSPPRTNSASLLTKGWELEVNWRDIIANDFRYNLTFMISDNVSEITEYHNPDNVLSQWYVGQTIGEIWGYEADGLFQTWDEVNEYLEQVDLTFIGTNWRPGHVKYKDLTGDGRVDEGNNTLDNHGDKRIIGNSSPRYRFSLQGGFAWRNIDMNILLTGVGKRDYWPDAYNTLFWGWQRRAHSTVTEATLDYWREDNPGAYLPIQTDNHTTSGYAKDRLPSTRYLQDASYMRLRSLNIGYTLPRSFTQKVNIKNLRVYCIGENIFTLTNLWENLDPELAIQHADGTNRHGPGRTYPLARTISFGVDVTF